MKRVLLGLSVLELLGVVACGGRVIEQPGSGGSEPSQPAPTNTAGSAGKAGSPDAANPFPGKELGQCMPGFDRAQNPTRACRWLTESGLCFEDSEAACDCVCPTDHDSVCAHGFDRGPNSATLVVCD